MQAIKDVNQSLVDDGLVQMDKIGIGAFFWSLPSKGVNDRQTLKAKTETKIEEVKTEINQLKTRISNSKLDRNDEDNSREAKLKEIFDL